jgi:hypothetical protein
MLTSRKASYSDDRGVAIRRFKMASLVPDIKQYANKQSAEHLQLKTKFQDMIRDMPEGTYSLTLLLLHVTD